ncbi:probable basic-leucine zipper transcription factor R [Drosophila tropicalis]|uniref:probable basic-leucine zipper transcription factor R n=1 Tax=Drosophila tropicalis TaxID=46794 RepID=UPI0035AB86FB
MDDVPVKIVERYKPPPASVYQLPQSILNRLGQGGQRQEKEDDHAEYDFQLEKCVLEKAQRWHQLRQQQRQERQERQEKRKRELEAKQKAILGAVEYPSASSSSSEDNIDDDEDKHKQQQSHGEITQKETEKPDSFIKPKSIIVCNFNNILQPTILTSSSGNGTTMASSCDTSNATSKQAAVNGPTHKRNSSFNYADFEYNMNSTPFDNCELKTINDLDILAQVLHQTQLEERRDQQQPTIEQLKELPTLTTAPDPAPAELTVTTLAETKAALDSVNFHVNCDEDDGDDSIPSGRVQDTSISSSSASAFYQTPNYSPSQQQQQFQAYQLQGYNQLYYPQQQQVYHSQHNYFNGFGTPPNTQDTPSPWTTQTTRLAPQQHQQLLQQEVDIKSKSVPDILRELKTELQQQADKRRNRLHSHNEKNHRHEHDKEKVLEDNSKEMLTRMDSNQMYLGLAGPAQKLAKRISMMGFPLERVAKVVNLCGIDDKKIIEHLIPLGELMDLGFDETKISAALMKFNNNKDKALDYLIN